MKHVRVKDEVKKSHTARKAAESPALSTPERRERFRQFLKYTGITLIDFGEICGLTNPMLSMFKTEKRDLSDKAWARVDAAMTQVVAQHEAEYKAAAAKLSGETTRIIVNNAVSEAKRKRQVEDAASTAVTDVWKVVLSWTAACESRLSAEAREREKESLQLLKENVRDRIFPHINQLVTQRNYWGELAQSQAQVISVQRKHISRLKARLVKLEQRASAATKAK